MQLLLIRHATAEDHGHPAGDSSRALVEKGQKQARRVANFLCEQDLIPDVLLTSPVLRAKETAEILAEGGSPKPTIEPWLSCGMRPEEAVRELRAYREIDRVAIVGHEPDFSILVEFLIGANPGTIKVKKTSVLGIDMGRYPQLMFSLPCAFLD